MCWYDVDLVSWKGRSVVKMADSSAKLSYFSHFNDSEQSTVVAYLAYSSEIEVEADQ